MWPRSGTLSLLVPVLHADVRPDPSLSSKVTVILSSLSVSHSPFAVVHSDHASDLPSSFGLELIIHSACTRKELSIAGFQLQG